MWSPTFANMTPPINDFDTNGLRRQLVQRKGQKSRLRKGQFQRLPGLRGSSPSAPNAASSRGADIDVVTPEGMPDHRLVEGELDLKLWILHRWKGTPINAAPDEHETIGWFAFSEARALELPMRVTSTSLKGFRALIRETYNSAGEPTRTMSD
jgi:hypothetical protein